MAQFAQQDPEVASLYAMDLVILGLLGAGFGLLGAVVSTISYRQGRPAHAEIANELLAQPRELLGDVAADEPA